MGGTGGADGGKVGGERLQAEIINLASLEQRGRRKRWQRRERWAGKGRLKKI